MAGRCGLKVGLVLRVVDFWSSVNCCRAAVSRLVTYYVNWVDSVQRSAPLNRPGTVRITMKLWVANPCR